MPTVYVTRKVHFNAAHRLHNPDKSDEWNRETYGKCNSPNWHGHNYVLEVTVAGSPDPETGYVMDLAVLKRLLEEHVIEPLDHKNLNLDVDFLHGVMPSTENLALTIWNRIVDHIPEPAWLTEVRLQETENNSAVYRGEDPGGFGPM
ncbi:MAG TPA: 6-carboxytetrahydropterin synthase [Rubricoccaceae bacterium]|nr:6-carboxytetrahydropterin synthase [Rubricoccaceae bacterium]